MNTNRAPLYGAVLTAVMGIFLIFGPLLRLFVINFAIGAHIHYGIIHSGGIVSLPSIGILLLYLSSFVYRRRLLAAYIAAFFSLLMLIYISVLHFYGFIGLVVLMLAILYLVAFIVGYKQFTINNNFDGLPKYLKRISLVSIVGVAYGVLGFYLLGGHFFHTHFSFLTSLDMAVDSLTGFSGTIAEPTHMGQLFIDSLGGIGIVFFIVLLGILFQPLGRKIRPHHEVADMDKAKKIILTYSTSSEDFFKLWPHDKHYFFSQDNQAFLAYTESGKTIIVLGDPVGNSSSFNTLVEDFTKHHYALGWSVAAINTTDPGKFLFEKHGFKSLFIGNEGIVDIHQFRQVTSSDKHFRYVTNKSRRDSLRVEEWQRLNEDRLTKLQTISNAWLARDGRREYTFFMGYFDRAYLQECRVFVLFQDDTPVGYVNLIPSFYPGHESLDQFRAGSDISSIGMHFLLLKVIETLHAEHAKTLNIGLSPLSGIEKDSIDLVPRATLQLMRLLGASYYSFKGLEQFKNKFKPNWEPRSIVFSGAGPNLLRISRDIERASNYEPLGNRNLYVTTTVGVVVLTLGLYFILG